MRPLQNCSGQDNGTELDGFSHLNHERLQYNFSQRKEAEMKFNFWALLLLCCLAGRAMAEDGSAKNDTSLNVQSQAASGSVASHTLICPKCHGEMEEGVVPVLEGGSFFPSIWLKKSAIKNPGKFRASFLGYTMSRISVAKGGWSQAIPISVFRCKSCGYLEPYAK